MSENGVNTWNFQVVIVMAQVAALKKTAGAYMSSY